MGGSQLGISVHGLLALLLWAHGLAKYHGREQAVARQEAETDRVLEPAAPSPTFNAPRPAAYRPVPHTHTGHNVPPWLISLEASSQTQPARAVQCCSPAASRSNQGHKMNRHSSQGRKQDFYLTLCSEGSYGLGEAFLVIED